MVDFSVNCESVSAEVSTEEGYFVSGEHNFRTGSNTIFAGGKLEIPGVASLHGGIYMTCSQSGQFEDARLKGTTDIGLGEVASVGLDGPSAVLGIAGGPSVELPLDPQPE